MARRISEVELSSCSKDCSLVHYFGSLSEPYVHGSDSIRCSPATRAFVTLRYAAYNMEVSALVLSPADGEASAVETERFGDQRIYR